VAGFIECLNLARFAGPEKRDQAAPDTRGQSLEMVDLTGLELVGSESEILEAEIKCESAARLLAQLRSLVRERTVSDAYLNTLESAKLVDSAESKPKENGTTEIAIPPENRGISEGGAL
jgi:hypothetical protein